MNSGLIILYDEIEVHIILSILLNTIHYIFIGNMYNIYTFVDF